MRALAIVRFGLRKQFVTSRTQVRHDSLSQIGRPTTSVLFVIGRVLGTDDATPLQFWVAIAEGSVVQLDDVIAIDRILPTGERIAIYGIVNQVRARHEGATFDSDVFLIADGVLPAEVSEAAMVQVTRVVPEAVSYTHLTLPTNREV